MTFCLGMSVQDGIIGLADTRITSGRETITASKVFLHQLDGGSMFIMTSGLRSVRDKAMTYFEEVLAQPEARFDKLYKAVNAFAQQVRAVAAEDKQALRDAKLHFDLHCLIGGQLAGDPEPRLYLLYPQANWVEVSHGTPYFVVGESGYGKPLLDRMLRFDTGMDVALKIGYLAFDATRTSSNNVGFPIDVVVLRANAFEVSLHRYEEEQLKGVSAWWQQRLHGLVEEIPSDWIEPAFHQASGNVRRLDPRSG